MRVGWCADWNEMFWREIAEKIKSLILCSITSFLITPVMR